MKRTSLFLLLVALISFSCGSALHTIFNDHKTPHEQYADHLEDKHLDTTPEGRQWLAAAKKALEDPQTIAVPFRLNGLFQQDKPRSLGLQFHARRGEQLRFELNKVSPNFVLYADLFRADSTDPSPLFSADTGINQFSFDIEETGDYILRLQPQLFQTGEYSLSITAAPTLGFPVAYKKANIGSFWGDDRDGGKRRHEGVDIFAPKHSLAIAAADGYITGVKEGGLGGKTVWLRPEGKNYTLYYAHLDKQLVQEGQFVKKGEAVGLVGNTGNAKYTPSHLHFGVYTYGGAIDPLPFVKQSAKSAAPVPDKYLGVSLKMIKTKRSGDHSIKANTELVPLAVTSKGYMAELPDGTLTEVSFSEVKTTRQESSAGVATMPSSPSKKS